MLENFQAWSFYVVKTPVNRGDSGVHAANWEGCRPAGSGRRFFLVDFLAAKSCSYFVKAFIVGDPIFGLA